MPALTLTPRQRRHLRGLAHSLEPVVHLGKAGLTAGVVGSVEQALLSHELIKVQLRQPEDKKAEAEALAEATGAALCGLVGHVVILYRPHPEKPQVRIS